MNVQLLIIDPQNDFCDPGGALYVPGAENDMKRLAGMIRGEKDHIGAIHVTLDTHHLIDVAHPIYWVDANGEHPKPFETVISVEDVMAGKWRATDARHQERALAYVESLRRNNRYSLIIWPYHCLIGSWGHGVYPALFDALGEWERGFRMIDYSSKGFNVHTEHYSAVQADVPDPDDPSTQLNTRLIRSLREADRVGLAGEALNFCVANTVRDIVHNMEREQVEKMVLLRDATSPVPGKDFEPLTRQFLDEMIEKGMRVSRTDEFFAS